MAAHQGGGEALNSGRTQGKWMRLEVLERLRFLASLPLAGTAQREGGGIRIANNRIIPHPFSAETLIFSTYLDHSFTLHHDMVNVLSKAFLNPNSRLSSGWPCRLTRRRGRPIREFGPVRRSIEWPNKAG